MKKLKKKNGKSWAQKPSFLKFLTAVRVTRRYQILIALALSATFNHSFAVTLNELRTVALEGPGLTGIEVQQKLYQGSGSTLYLQREHNIFLAITRSVELGISIPWLNTITDDLSISSLGDMKFHLNVALYPTTSWIQKIGLFNFLTEFNLGTGLAYDASNAHPIGSYGYQEWRLGFIHFKKFKYFSIHGNLFYVFKSGNEILVFNEDQTPQIDEDTGQQVSKLETTFYDNVTEGNFLNIFSERSWQQWLGFNWNHPDAFFYRKNLENDIVELNFAVNSEIPYPFVPFVEVTLSFDFLGEQRENYFQQKAAESGIAKNQIALGTKYFFNEDAVAFKAALILPLGPLRELYNFGLALGVKIDF